MPAGSPSSEQYSVVALPEPMMKAGTLCEASGNSRLILAMKALASSTDDARSRLAMKRELETAVSARTGSRGTTSIGVV